LKITKTKKKNVNVNVNWWIHHSQ